MISFRNSLTIERPVHEVFDFLSDFENMSKWNYFVLEVHQISDGPRRMGTTYDQVRKSDRQQYRITEYEPNRVVAIRTLPPAQDLHMRFVLEPLGDHTVLTDEWEFDTGRNALIERLGSGRVKSAVAENLEKLKQLLETGEVQLQDGRKVSI
jgi:uncharacterized membrane protein